MKGAKQMNIIKTWPTALTLLLGSVAANAQLIPVNGGGLVNDPIDKLTWLQDADFFATQAVESGNPAEFVQTIISISGGVIDDLPNDLDNPANSGKHKLTTNDFYHDGSIDGHLTWFGAQAWVNYLNVTDYEGYSNWQLPTTVDGNSSAGYPNGGAHDPAVTSSQLAELFYGRLGQVAGQPIQKTHNASYALFRNVGSSYWSGTQVANASSSAWIFVDAAGTQLKAVKETYNQALAVRSGQAYQCDTTYNGTYHGNVTVSSGLVCIVNATIMGNVQQAGGQLRLVGSIVAGNVQVNGDGQFTIGPGAIIENDLQIQNLAGGSVENQICDATVRGNLQFQNNGTAVEIGATTPSCLGNIIGGNIQVQNNTSSTAITNNVVVGNLEDHNNAAPTGVFDNYVEQNLQCQNNSAITGRGDSAKQKQGQCSAF
jgi:hypothetical protein